MCDCNHSLDEFCEACFRAKPGHDMVNHPPHYTNGSIECVDAIKEALGKDGFIAYCRGTAIKYAWRAGSKDDLAQDLRKGAWYLNKAAETLEVDR